MNKLKVLILEDNSIIALHISELLKSNGCEIIGISRSGEHAIKLASKTHVDLLIADINIDGALDGTQTAKNIQDTYKSNVIFLTAYKDDKTLQRASLVNFIGYLLKPFREDELIALIKMIKAKLKPKEKIQLSDQYTYCLSNKEIYFSNEKVDLTTNEKVLLNLLISANNSIVHYETIDETIWYNEPKTTGNRRQLIHRLKHKLPDLEFVVEKNIGLKLPVFD